MLSGTCHLLDVNSLFALKGTKIITHNQRMVSHALIALIFMIENLLYHHFLAIDDVNAWGQYLSLTTSAQIEDEDIAAVLEPVGLVR